MMPLGGYRVADEPLVLWPDRPRVTLDVTNTGDRPVQVGSHYHFFEVNPALVFDRAKAWGMRLAILAGTSVRFEPGSTRTVELIPFGGRRRVIGFHGLCDGWATSPVPVSILGRLTALGFGHREEGREA